MSKTDITKQGIVELAQQQYGISAEHLEPYGHYKAKLSLGYIESLASATEGKLILTTAISPTPAGEGKTTTSIGLCDAMANLGKQVLVCLREPSLGPCFGMKGGATGGGLAQLVPREDINLHFTGDFHAIGAAQNLLAAMLDNHLFHGNALDINPASIPCKRVMDMNDRALIRLQTAAIGNTGSRETGFEITAACEVMAIFCLADSLPDLKRRLGNIVVGYTRGDHQPVYARNLKAHGAMTALLKEAFKPNLVQTLEHNLALVHGGPFANIAHGCNSVIATRTALKLADYVITEAGFGADLGAEKFIDITCRMAGFKPAAMVLVATVRALKYQGGVATGDLDQENLEALTRGLPNLQRHLDNIREHYQLPCIVCINHFKHDTAAETELLVRYVASQNIPVQVSYHFDKGGAGAVELARAVIDVLDNHAGQHHYVYSDTDSLWTKIEQVAKKIYGAAMISASTQTQEKIASLDRQYPDYPICIAKTPMSFSSNPALKGAPQGHTLEITDVRPSAGAGFIIVFCGKILAMPGLPRLPAAEHIDVDEQGNITGLS